jgi:hypothetical protein
VLDQLPGLNVTRNGVARSLLKPRRDRSFRGPFRVLLLREPVHPWEKPKECAGIRNLGDRAEVRLTAEQVCDAGVIADSHTNLLDNVLLYEDIAEIDDIAEIAEIEIADIAGDRAGVRLTAEQVCDAGVIADSHTNLLDNVLLYDDIAEIEAAVIAEVEVPQIPLVPFMPAAKSSTHGVKFRIEQFTHLTHELRSSGVACEQHLAQASRRLTARIDA